MSNLKEFIRSTDENNGATFNLNTGQLNPKSGYFVALKGQELKVKYNNPINEIVQKFVLKNSIDLSNNNTFVGSWIEDGLIYLDVVVMLEDEDEAIKLGLKNEQLAIYNASTKQVITL